VQGKKVLITGATGSVARGIVRALAPDNEVWAAARFTDAQARRSLEGAGVRTFAWTLGEDRFEGLPRRFDYVIHAAANIFDTARDYDAAIRANAEGTGLLMAHVRESGAFLFVSSLQVYSEIADKSRARLESEPLGSHPNYAPSYSISKIATEAVVRTLCRLYGLPTTIGRLGVNYGPGCAGLPDAAFREMLAGRAMVVPPRGRSRAALVYNPDVIRQVEPLLAAASVPATIVNWNGDEGVEYRELLDHMAALAGLQPTYEEREGAGPVAGYGDAARRIAITGPAQDWRSAVRATLRANYPDLGIPEHD
jgi:nucleoside-diphosphate-sugar epimerase